MISQMVNTLPIKKTTPSHNGHVEIDLSKMMEWSFDPYPNWAIFYYIF
jgi:hypothetical protein